MQKNRITWSLLAIVISVSVFSSLISALVTYEFVKPNPNEIDPRCDKVFIEKSIGGKKPCDEANEQREWLRYLKDPNGS